jgi:hypothetical protein
VNSARRQWWVCRCDACLPPPCPETSFPARWSGTAWCGDINQSSYTALRQLVVTVVATLPGVVSSSAT